MAMSTRKQGVLNNSDGSPSGVNGALSLMSGVVHGYVHNVIGNWKTKMCGKCPDTPTEVRA